MKRLGKSKYHHKKLIAMKTNFTQLMTALSLVLLLLFMTGCPKKPMDPKLPIVNLLENAVEVGPNMAVLYAEVTDDGSAVIRERGFCYGKEGGAMDTLFCEAKNVYFLKKHEEQLKDKER